MKKIQYKICCDGIPIDTRCNFYKSFEDAEKDFVNYCKLKGCKYTIIKIETSIIKELN